MLTGIMQFLGGLVQIAATWMQGYGGPKAVEARRLADEKRKKDDFDHDLVLARDGDTDAAERVRARLHR